MIDFDPSTPQLKAVKRAVDAYSSLDMNRAVPLKRLSIRGIPQVHRLPTGTDKGKSPPGVGKYIFPGEKIGGTYPTLENRLRAPGS